MAGNGDRMGASEMTVPLDDLSPSVRAAVDRDDGLSHARAPRRYAKLRRALGRQETVTIERLAELLLPSTTTAPRRTKKARR